jgi:hypothetical protein
VEGIERERSEVVRQSSQERKGPSRVSGQRLFDMTQSFKDREAPRAELYRHLASPGAPLVTVVGRAGIGKTALVSRFVGEIVRPPDDEAPRGFSVDGIAILSRETSAITLEQVFTACGRMLGGEVEAGLHKLLNSDAPLVEKTAGLLDALSGGTYVILLDHFEDLLDDKGRVADEPVRALLDACLATPGRVKLLITSRVPLTLEGPVRRYNLQVKLDDGLPVAEGIALLREFDPNGNSMLRDAPDEVLEQVVKRLYGLPRALELLPGIIEKSPQHTLDQILDRFYTFDDVGHALVRAAYDRLDANAHLVPQGLAEFRRPTTIEALDFLLAPFLPRGTDVPALTGRLAELQMLKSVRGERDAAGREIAKVSMYPIDQDFTNGRIPEDGPASRRALERRADRRHLRRLPRVPHRPVRHLLRAVLRGAEGPARRVLGHPRAGHPEYVSEFLHAGPE